METLELQNFGVIEMNDKELRDVESEFIPIVLAAIALGISADAGDIAAGTILVKPVVIQLIKIGTWRT